MKAKWFTWFTAALFVFGLVRLGNAAIIYEQQYNPADQGAHIADDPGWAVFDNFSLLQNASVSGATIWGVYWSDGQIPTPARFNLGFYTSPDWGSDLYFLTVDAVSVIDTGYDHNNTPGANILEITFDFGSWLDFVAGQEYWFGVQAVNSSLDNSFAWQNSYAVDNRYYQNNTQILNQADVAFRIDGVNVVPEPATWLLVGSGLAGLVVFRKKIVRK